MAEVFPPEQDFPRWPAPAARAGFPPVRSPALLRFALPGSCVFLLRAQMLQSLLGRELLGLLFRAAFSAGHIFRLVLALNVDAGLNCERLAMVWPLFLYRGRSEEDTS